MKENHNFKESFNMPTQVKKIDVASVETPYL